MTAPTLVPPFLSPAWRQVSSSPLQLGESPFWCATTQRLVCVDIGAQAICRLNPADGHWEHWPMPQTPGCIAPTATGGFCVALRDGVYTASGWGGALQRAWAYAPDAQGLRLNDGKADAEGNFWVGSYSDLKQPTAELVCLKPAAAGWQVLARHTGFPSSNGLAFSGGDIFWADTAGHRVLRFGAGLRNPQVWAQFAPKPSGWDAASDPAHQAYAGRPDGATVDAASNYWVAMYEGSAVLQISPAGQVLARLRTPVLRPTMPCLGGANRQTLFVTTAHAPTGSAEHAAQPNSGHVFACEVGAQGLPVDAVKDS